jgi:hypothetical protein
MALEVYMGILLGSKHNVDRRFRRHLRHKPSISPNPNLRLDNQLHHTSLQHKHSRFYPNRHKIEITLT